MSEKQIVCTVVLEASVILVQSKDRATSSVFTCYNDESHYPSTASSISSGTPKIYLGMITSLTTFRPSVLIRGSRDTDPAHNALTQVSNPSNHHHFS